MVEIASIGATTTAGYRPAVWPPSTAAARAFGAVFVAQTGDEPAAGDSAVSAADAEAGKQGAGGSQDGAAPDDLGAPAAGDTGNPGGGADAASPAGGASLRVLADAPAADGAAGPLLSGAKQQQDAAIDAAPPTPGNPASLRQAGSALGSGDWGPAAGAGSDIPATAGGPLPEDSALANRRQPDTERERQSSAPGPKPAPSDRVRANPPSPLAVTALAEEQQAFFDHAGAAKDSEAAPDERHKTAGSTQTERTLNGDAAQAGNAAARTASAPALQGNKGTDGRSPARAHPDRPAAPDLGAAAPLRAASQPRGSTGGDRTVTDGARTGPGTINLAGDASPPGESGGPHAAAEARRPGNVAGDAANALAVATKRSGPAAERPLSGAIAAGLQTGQHTAASLPPAPAAAGTEGRAATAERFAGFARLTLATDARKAASPRNGAGIAGKPVDGRAALPAQDARPGPHAATAADTGAADARPSPGPVDGGFPGGGDVAGRKPNPHASKMKDSADAIEGSTGGAAVRPPSPRSEGTGIAGAAAPDPRVAQHPAAAVAAPAVPAQLGDIFALARSALDDARALTGSEVAPALADDRRDAPGPTVPAERPAPARPAIPPTVIEATLRRTASDRIDLALDSAELGRVRLVLAIDGDHLHLTCGADRPETAELLRRSAPILAAELRDGGFGSTSFDFERGTPRQPRLGQPPAGPTPEAPTPAPTSSAAARPAAGRLDLRI
ncbi:MAG: flagellar hook-length control protein FliK [Gemmobacter sp.]